ELEKSADALQDYGVLVGKVNCNKELVSTYCTNEHLLHRAFLFRYVVAILREEVKYVHTDTDLMIMEKAARGRQDIVLGYVLSLGTREHRSLMETAYAYGSKYQFILITGGPVLKYLGQSSSCQSGTLWFLHCRLHSGPMSPVNSERCMFTNMLKPLTTLNLHSFLQLMEAPLTEAYDDPSSVQPPPVPYQETPQVFLFSRPATAHLDLDTATTLAWKLRGLALVLLVHRCTLCVVLGLLTLFRGKKCEYPYVLLGLSSDKLDDEVAASVYENPAKMPDMDSITHLTFDNFHDAVAQSSLTVAVFYFKWDAVSMAFLSSFIAVADRLADSEVQMSGVDCGEWTHLCAAQSGGSFPIPFQPITTFPCVLLLRPQEPAQHYRGMLDAAALHRFIILPAAPLCGGGRGRLWAQTDPGAVGGDERSCRVKTEEDGEIPGLLDPPVRTSVSSDNLSIKTQNQHCSVRLSSSGRTPAGMSVLGSYLGSMPPLPALVLTHLPSGDEIYQYPTNTPIVAPSVLQWLQRIEAGAETPAGKGSSLKRHPALFAIGIIQKMCKALSESLEKKQTQTHMTASLNLHIFLSV
uniref:Uncharacterized protein n=1 Tax=Mola mola TaxID=94237 RepID=A0A3Q3VSV8_MOLML